MRFKKSLLKIKENSTAMLRGGERVGEIVDENALKNLNKVQA
jgi:hypothetical protein